jgi:hypothetical protein
MIETEEPNTLRFRCPEGLEALLPPPTPAAFGLPGWLRSMPAQAFSAIAAREDDTVKRCPPFVDAMTAGFLIPLMCDVTVKDGAFSWDSDLPPGDFARAPLGLHDPGQVAGTPLFDADRVVIKFHNLWAIEAPPGWSVLFTHPANRFDLPFVTLTGLVDCDRWPDVPINFPAHWRDADFSGVLPAGTPIAQGFPIRREAWAISAQAFTPEETRRSRELSAEIARDKGVYRRRFRAPNR